MTVHEMVRTSSRFVRPFSKYKESRLTKLAQPQLDVASANVWPACQEKST